MELPEEIWQRTLPLLTQLAPYVVVDTASAADGVLCQVLTHADELLVLTDTTITGLYSARALIETIRAEQGRKSRIHVVLNQADVQGGLGPALIEKHLGLPVDLAIPTDPALATLACNRGVPFVLSDPRAQISRRVQQLAERLAPDTPTVRKAALHRKPVALSLLSLFR
jgi:pilus assembly protein CpaE